MDPYPLEPPAYEDTPVPTVVERSHACRRCGYELRGLPVSGVCPECGASVERSLRGDLLALADPGYLKRLRLGAVMVEWAIALICLVPTGGLLLATLSSIADFDGTGMFPFLLLLAALLCIAAGVLVIAGWYMLTSPDPARLGADIASRSRTLTRIATVVCAGAWGVSAAISASSSVAAIAPATFALLLRIAGVSVVLAACVQVLVSLRYLQHLSTRIRDRSLQEEVSGARSVAIVLATFVAIGFVGALGVSWCIALASFLIAAILSIMLLVQYGGMIDRLRRNLNQLIESASPAE